LVRYPVKSKQRPKMGILGVVDHDWLCRDICLYRLRTPRKRTLASEYYSERFIRCGHWPVGLFPIQRRQKMNTINKTARIAGVLYLLLIVFGITAQVIRSIPLIPIRSRCGKITYKTPASS
jgi:hypothetical protein